MLRAALAVGTALVLALGAAQAGESGGTGARPFAGITRNFISAIGMDGPILAYDVIGGFDAKARKGYCNRVFALNVNTRVAVQVSSERGLTCDAGATSTGAGIFQLAVAGTRVAWLDNEGGNTETDYYLLGSSVVKPRERRIASTVGTGGSVKALGGLVGDRNLLAVSAFTRTATGAVASPALRLVTPTRLGATVQSGASAIVSQSADLGRIAVLTPAHRAVLYSSGGRLLHSWSAPTATEVAVHGDYVVLLERGRLDVESAVTGRHVKAIAIQTGAYGLDVDSGIAVYARRNVVHAVLLSAGRDVAFAKAPNPIVGVTLEAPGLAYAWGTFVRRTNVQTGHLAFVPLAALRAKLG